MIRNATHIDTIESENRLKIQAATINDRQHKTNFQADAFVVQHWNDHIWINKVQVHSYANNIIADGETTERPEHHNYHHTQFASHHICVLYAYASTIYLELYGR